MRNDTTHGNRILAEERPELLIACGIGGLVGMTGPVVAGIAATLLTDHQFIADTISEMGKGPRKTIMDTGFYMNAAGLLGLSIAAAHAHLGRTAWTLGIFCLAFLALTITLIGVWDDFRTPDRPGRSVHTWLTFALGPLYLAGPLLMARGAAREGRIYAVIFVISALAWIALATAFKLAPTTYDGVLEKLAIAATMLWTTALSVLFLRRGLAA